MVVNKIFYAAFENLLFYPAQKLKTPVKSICLALTTFLRKGLIYVSSLVCTENGRLKNIPAGIIITITFVREPM
jgi:hypothetical protein